MPRATQLTTNFTGGQISDSMDGRVDTVIYQNGAKQLENFLVTTQGSAKRRQGTRYINSAKISDKRARLIPFEFSNSQTYALEFGDGYIRFYRDGGVILSGGSEYEIASPYLESDLPNLQYVQNKDVMYIVDGRNPIQRLSRFGDTDWRIEEFPLVQVPARDRSRKVNVEDEIQNGLADPYDGLGAWTDESLGSSFVSINLYRYRLADVGTDDAILRQKLIIKNENNIHQLKFYLYLGDTISVRIGTTPGGDDIVALTAGTAGTFNPIDVDPAGNKELYIDFVRDGSLTDGFSEINSISLKTKLTTLDINQIGTDGFSAGTQMTLTATNFSPFSEDSIGEYYILWDDDTTTNPDSVAVRVVGINSATEALVTSLEDIPASVQDTTQIFAQGAWGDSAGYPKAIAFYEQRLILGNTNLEPQKLWFSQSGVFDIFNDGSEASDGFNREISSSQMSNIRWIIPTKENLLVGTSNGEYVIFGGGENDAITPTNIAIRQHTNYGSKAILPAYAEGNVLFAQRNGRILRALGYNFNIDGYNGDDVTIYADDVLGLGIKELAYQKSISRILWAVLEDGDIACLTYEPSQKISAWSKHTTDGEFESIISIAGSNADEIWVVVKRTIDGSVVRYIERFEPETSDDFMVDCGAVAESVAGYDYSGDNFSALTETVGTLRALTFDGTYFWVIGSTDDIYKYDSAGNYLSTTWSFTISPAEITSVAHDGTYLYINGNFDFNSEIYYYTEAGAFQGSFLNTNVLTIGKPPIIDCFTFDGTNFWIVIDDIAYKFDNTGTYTGDTKYLEIDTTGNSITGITFDGTNFWVLVDDGRVYKYDSSLNIIGTDWVAFNTSAEDVSPIDITNNGTDFWVAGASTDVIYEYSFTASAGFGTVSGLDYLEGKTVDVVNDGVAETQKVVTGGEITLDNDGVEVYAGLPYSSSFRSRRAEAGSANGSAQGKPKTLPKVFLRLRNSEGGQYSVDGSSFYDFEYRNTGAFSGDKEIVLPNGYDTIGDVYVRQNKPLPLIMQLINLLVITNDT